MTIHEAGGHIPKFPEGEAVRVSPNNFILRHYRIRSYEHGLRKVFRERLPRYSPELRRSGWHVHYNKFGTDKSYFIINSSKLTRYNEDGNWNLTKTFDGSFGAWNPPSTSEKISRLESTIQSLRSELEDIRSSFGYKVMRFYASKIERVCPERTRRGEERMRSLLRKALEKFIEESSE